MQCADLILGDVHRGLVQPTPARCRQMPRSASLGPATPTCSAAGAGLTVTVLDDVDRDVLSRGELKTR